MMQSLFLYHRKLLSYDIKRRSAVDAHITKMKFNCFVIALVREEFFIP